MFVAEAFDILEQSQFQREETAPADRLDAIRRARADLMPGYRSRWPGQLLREVRRAKGLR
jgi:hypothetical protein